MEENKILFSKSLKPHIQLCNFEDGLFSNEKIGYFLSYDEQEHYLVMQKGNSNFTDDDLLEVIVCESEGDKTLIQVYNLCMPDYGLVKTSDLKYFGKNELQYLKD